ncbi:MAG: helix-turn-helix transcriptional regulator [Hungatella sp.]|nr:helix-turn-helix transcriptional regulator [Hungatella sp.]
MKTSYLPLTAAPWKQNQAYREILPVSPGLSGVIRCFWGSDVPYEKRRQDSHSTVVIPDTCVDIIYEIDYTDNTVAGKFCGINDTSFVASEAGRWGHLVSVFGIRFYAWAVCAFLEDSLKGTLNGCYDAGSRFHWLDRKLRQQLFEKNSLKERSRLTEELLLKNTVPLRQSSVVNHAAKIILLQKGALSIEQLAGECLISSRQLERLFQEYIGIGPKKLCSLVRYQYLWGEVVRNPGFCVSDAVYQYGYTDQSHLIREFKRYHTMDIRKAAAYARSSGITMSEIYNLFPAVSDTINGTYS